MAEIYTNFAFDSFELKPENFVENLEAYAKRLEAKAKEFKTFAKFIKTKKVKILETKGFAYSGSFCVDDIDTARLEKAGLVIDLNKDLPDELLSTNETPTFYIDAELDEVLDKLDKADLILDKETQFNIANIEEDEIEEQSSLLNLVELLKDVEVPEKTEDEDDDFSPGTLVVDVKQVGEHQYSFNLTVADLNNDPVEVKFNREKGIFEYKCGTCDDTHTETIASVFRSLKTTNALLSNLIAMIQDPKELAVALEFIDHDLRLLQHLVAFDYALSDNEGVVKEDDDCDHEGEEECDHEDEDEDDDILDFEADMDDEENDSEESS